MEKNSVNEGEEYHFQRGAQSLFPTRDSLVSLLFDVVGFFLSIGLVYLGYWYGKDRALKQTIVSRADSPKSVSMTFSLTPQPLLTQTPSVQVANIESLRLEDGSCVETAYQVTNQNVSLCLPKRFILLKANTRNEQIYRADNEELVFELRSQTEYPLHVCTSQSKQSVKTLSGTRYEFKHETGAGCGSFSGYATLFSRGTMSTLLPISLRYRLVDNGVVTDSKTYDSIEQSIQIE